MMSKKSPLKKRQRRLELSRQKLIADNSQVISNLTKRINPPENVRYKVLKNIFVKILNEVELKEWEVEVYCKNSIPSDAEEDPICQDYIFFTNFITHHYLKEAQKRTG